MRKLLLLFGLIALLAPSAAHATTYARVQQTAFASSSSSTLAQTYSSNNTTGDILVAIVHMFFGGTVTGVPADSCGNTWVSGGAGSDGMRIFYVRSAVSCGSPDTVTATVSNGGLALISLAEYSGQPISGVVLDFASPGNNGSSASPSISSYLGYANDLMIVSYASDGVSASFSAFTGGFTQQESSVETSWGDNLASSTGLNSTGCTASVSGAWSAAMWAFLPAGHPTTANLNFVRRVYNGVKDQSGSPAQIVFDGGNAPGDTILIGTVQFFATSDAVTSITDTAGDIFTRIAQHDFTNGADAAWSAIYACNGCVGSSSTNTISVAYGAGITDAMEIFAVEYGGKYNFDTSTANVTTTGNSNSGTITAAAAGELLFSQISVFSQTQSTYTTYGVNITNNNSITFAAGESLVAFLTPSLSGSNTVSASTSEGGYNGGVNLLTVALAPSSGAAPRGHALIF